MNNITLSSFMVFMGMLACALNAQVKIQVPGDYPTIQAAVDAAYSGDTILVAPGTYQENIRIQGNDKIITLASNFIFSGDTTDINNTIIDGSNPVESDYSMVVLITNQVASPSTKIMGFTITGGKGYYQTYGGGFYASAAAPVIEYNHIQNCSVTGVQPNGAGIYIGNAAGNPNMICSINHNVIRNCTINAAINSVVANGAGISVNSVKAVIEENEITDNIILGNSTASCSGGGIYYFGNIPEDFHPQLSIIHNEITNNRVESWQAEGGGVALYGYTQYIIEGNIISSNEAASTNVSGYALGGGLDICNPGPGSVISNNIISHNHSHEGPYSSARFGGGIYLTRNPNRLPEIYPLIEKNRITGNTASFGAGIAFVRTGARLINNFISGNMALMAGGAVYFCGPADTAMVSEVINNTITQNSASSQEGKGGSIYCIDEMKVLLMNDIFYGNKAVTSEEMKIDGSTVRIYNCDINADEISGTWTGEHNFFADPEFTDEMTWDCSNNEAPCSESGIDSIKVFDYRFGAPGDDILGNERPQGEFADVGAFEVNMCVGYEEAGSRHLAVSNYPNPFRDYSTFEYMLDEPGMVTLKIFNQAGQMEIMLVNEHQAPGAHHVIWNAEGMPAGIYYYSLKKERQPQTGKIVIVK